MKPSAGNVWPEWYSKCLPFPSMQSCAALHSLLILLPWVGHCLFSLWFLLNESRHIFHMHLAQWACKCHGSRSNWGQLNGSHTHYPHGHAATYLRIGDGLNILASRISMTVELPNWWEHQKSFIHTVLTVWLHNYYCWCYITIPKCSFMMPTISNSLYRLLMYG